jgi:hypothetical protein
MLLSVVIIAIYAVGIASAVLLKIYGIILSYTAAVVPERGMLIFAVVYTLLNVTLLIAFVLLLSIEAWRRYMYWLAIWLLATVALVMIHYITRILADKLSSLM